MMNFFDHIQDFGAATAVITEASERRTYADLAAASDVVCDKVGHRCLVFCLCENSFESIAGYIGFLRGRIVPVMLNSTISHEQLAGLLQTYRPEYIWLPKDKAASGNLGDEVLCCGHYLLLKTHYVTDYLLHEELAMLLTTSGSTGSPMLVRQSYRNISTNADSITRYLGIADADRAITTMPMSYTYGLSIINSHLLKGALIILTKMTFMDKEFWEALRKHEATTFGGVPYVYEMLRKLRFSRMNLPSLKILTQAGGKLSPELAREFGEICVQKGIRFFIMYGQTEATARMSYLPSEHAVSKFASIGIAIPGGEFWLEDENGEVISASDTVGELVYKGENVTLGYAMGRMDLAKGDENEGVLRTGDIAKRDPDGFYYIVGRKKRFLKIFGNRINLDEVEQIIKKAGFDCACAGEDDHMRIYTSSTGNHAEIKNVAVRLTSIHPSAFEVVSIERIPRNESGKVLYSKLVQVPTRDAGVPVKPVS